MRPAEPFPAPALFDWPDRDRTRYFARALRCPSNTVTQIQLRGLKRLASLRYVKELREP